MLGHTSIETLTDKLYLYGICSTVFQIFFARCVLVLWYLFTPGHDRRAQAYQREKQGEQAYDFKHRVPNAHGGVVQPMQYVCHAPTLPFNSPLYRSPERGPDRHLDLDLSLSLALREWWRRLFCA